MGQKKARQRRKRGLDEKAERKREQKRRKREQVKRRAKEEAEFREAQGRALAEVAKFKAGERFDPNVIIAGMSQAEHAAMRGQPVPSVMIFQRLMDLNLCALRENDDGKRAIVPTPLGIVVNNILTGQLKVVPGETMTPEGGIELTDAPEKKKVISLEEATKNKV